MRNDDRKNNEQQLSLISQNYSDYTDLAHNPPNPAPEAAILNLANALSDNDASAANEQLPQPSHEEAIIRSRFLELSPQQRAQQLAQEFNQNRASIMVDSQVYGKRIAPNEYRLVSKNGVPELVPFSEIPKRLPWYPLSPGVKVEELGVFSQTELCIGGSGHYLVNVPMGQYAKVYFGQQAKILGSGPHVIHENNFSIVQHEHLVNINDNCISHGDLHLVRVPIGNYCKVWVNNEPKLLPPQQEPYFFRTFNFSYQGLVNQTESYIQHGPIHVLRVPQGKIAKVWRGNKPELQESSDQPIVIEDPLFKLEKHTENALFADATEQLISHGPIKRFSPRTGEVAIAYVNGALKILEPKTDGSAYLENNPNFIVKKFLPITRQTLTFPSEKVKRQRRAEGLENDAIFYENCKTSDGLSVGLELLLTYEIVDAEKLLTTISLDDLGRHIEFVVVGDMNRVVRQHGSNDFMLSQNQTVASHEKVADSSVPSAPSVYTHLLDEMQQKLRDDLEKIGIRFHRFSIETLKILNAEISNTMEHNSLAVSKAVAEQRVAEQKNMTDRLKAEMEAQTRNIQQRTELSLRSAEAQSKVEIARLAGEVTNIEAESANKQMLAKAKAEADAVRIKSQAEADAIINRGKAEASAETERLSALGKALEKYPPLADFLANRARFEALQAMRPAMISPDVAQGLYGAGLFQAAQDSVQRELTAQNAAPASLPKPGASAIAE